MQRVVLLMLLGIALILCGCAQGPTAIDDAVASYKLGRSSQVTGETSDSMGWEFTSTILPDVADGAEIELKLTRGVDVIATGNARVDHDAQNDDYIKGSMWFEAETPAALPPGVYKLEFLSEEGKVLHSENFEVK